MAISQVRQYRAADQIYMFEAKDSQTLTLKIYDIWHSRVNKATIELPPKTLQELFQKRDTSTFLNLFPSYVVKAVPSLIQDPLEESGQLIVLLKQKIPDDGKEVESLACSLTLCLLKDPVIANCGHTFERGAIEEHMKKAKACPLDRAPITHLKPNFTLKAHLEALKSQEPIPTLALFKKENPILAKAQLDLAKTCLQHNEYQAALEAYASAFQYTGKWEDYQSLCDVYEKMQDEPRRELACLYLVKYQLQAKAYPDAFNTLLRLVGPGSSLIDPYPLLFYLYITHGEKGQTCQFIEGAKAYVKESPSKAPQLYQYLLYHYPRDWAIYRQLASLLSSPLEIAHLYLRGACGALEAKQTDIAEEFSRLALAQDAAPLLNHYPHFQLLQQETSKLISKLSNLLHIFKGRRDFKSAVKIYHYKIALEPSSPDYYYLIQAQLQLPKPQKALTWTLQGLQWLKQKDKEFDSSDANLTNLALELLSKYPPPDPASFYELILEFYSANGSPHLQMMLNRLGEAYYKQGNRPQAEMCYSRAFKEFPPTYEQALKLASILAEQPDKRAEAVQTYYEAINLLVLANFWPQLSHTLERLLAIDPRLQHLQTAQKVQVFTYKQICHLTDELTNAKKQIAELQARPQSFKKRQ